MSICFDPITPAHLTWTGDVPYSSQFEDIYFSIEHGLLESKHVFIDGNQLIERWKNLNPHASFVIAECGFGTGLNVLLAWKYFKEVAPDDAQLHFFSAEKHPLSLNDLKRCLALWPDLLPEAEGLFRVYPRILTPGFHQCVLDEGRVFLTLMLGDACDTFDSLLACKDEVLEPTLRHWTVDAWFLDGFAPAKNPHMWSAPLFTTMALLSSPTTTIATFSAAGHVRRGLQEAGFCVSKQSGYGKKFSMTVGGFDKIKTTPRALRCTPWHVSSRHQISDKKAIVIGAGLAGCFTAHALAKRGWHVTVIEQASKRAEGASGNQQAVLYPNLSAFRAPLTNFMLSAFIHAVRVYKPWIHHKLIPGELNGILQLAWNDKAAHHFASLTSWLKEYPALGRLVDSLEASELAGVHLEKSGLFIPDAGWINSPKLCDFLVNSPRINCVLGLRIDEIDFADGCWHAGSHQAPVLVVASGFNATSFAQTEHLSLFPFKGQMTAVTPSPASAHLKIPLCAKGHVLPQQQGAHWLGATYHPGLIDNLCHEADDKENMHTLAFLSQNAHHEVRVQNHWAGVRAATRDYLPLVGPVADCSLFNQTFSTLTSNAKRFIAHAGPHQAGLYLCAGFGSRGLTTIPLSAEYLAASITQEPFGLPREMVQSITPGRFLVRSLTRL